jgi:hypothetical protein
MSQICSILPKDLPIFATRLVKQHSFRIKQSKQFQANRTQVLLAGIHINIEKEEERNTVMTPSEEIQPN